jgi:HEXXH motif-containing protein
MVLGAKTELGISFTAPDRIGQSMDWVISYVSDREHVNTFAHAIRLIQSPETLNHEDTSFLEWEGPRTSLSRSLLAIMELKEFPPEWEIPYDRRDVYQEKFNSARTLISQYLPDTAISIDKLIFSYLFAVRPGYHGGTLSSKIGMIWLSPTLSWEVSLWAENIIHEFVHNALFLEDMVYNVFPYGTEKMAEPEALTLSAIRETKRGYDKSFHSAFVLLSIIRFYQKLGISIQVNQFIVSLTHCVDDLIKKPQYLAPHGKRLLDELVAATVSLAKNQIAV